MGRSRLLPFKLSHMPGEMAGRAEGYKRSFRHLTVFPVILDDFFVTLPLSQPSRNSFPTQPGQSPSLRDLSEALRAASGFPAHYPAKPPASPADTVHVLPGQGSYCLKSTSSPLAQLPWGEGQPPERERRFLGIAKRSSSFLPQQPGRGSSAILHTPESLGQQ